MSRLLDYIAEPETAVVFDVDGVLAIYDFGELGHAAAVDGDWETYVREHDPYATARPAPPIQRFVARKGCGRVFACSVGEDYEAPGKVAFVRRCYGLPADHVRIVADRQAKVDYLREVAHALRLPERRVALVEDTVKTLDAVASQTDCVTVHVSSFLAYE